VEIKEKREAVAYTHMVCPICGTEAHLKAKDVKYLGKTAVCSDCYYRYKKMKKLDNCKGYKE
jgi:C4-type Zn-finger protein